MLGTLLAAAVLDPRWIGGGDAEHGARGMTGMQQRP